MLFVCVNECEVEGRLRPEVLEPLDSWSDDYFHFRSQSCVGDVLPGDLLGSDSVSWQAMTPIMFRDLLQRAFQISRML